jgi:hypothetical protein
MKKKHEKEQIIKCQIQFVNHDKCEKNITSKLWYWNSNFNDNRNYGLIGVQNRVNDLHVFVQYARGCGKSVQNRVNDLIVFVQYAGGCGNNLAL